ncbi:MAG: hypothetical protein RLZZ232_2239 [Planctomycetota bacterium]
MNRSGILHTKFSALKPPQKPHSSLTAIIAALCLHVGAETSVFAQSFVDSWNRDGREEVLPGTPGSALSEVRRSNSGLPVSDRFLLEYSESNSEKPVDLTSAILSSPTRSTESPTAVPSVFETLQLTAFRDDARAASEAARDYDDSETTLSVADPTALLQDSQVQAKSRVPAAPAQLFRNPPGPSDSWQLLPSGLLYRTYLAGPKEPRLQYLSQYDVKNKRQVADAVLGGRVGLLRKSSGLADDPDAFQLDVDGAVFARVLPEEPSSMLEGSDYRVGLAGTWKQDELAWKLGYCHISSHIGDEFLLAYPATPRMNYVRDSVIAGISYDVLSASRVYAEAGYAIGISGGAEPFELQLGSEWTPRPRGRQGAPFAAVNAQFREEQGTRAGLNTSTGWGWEGARTGHRLRIGANYYNGPALQYSFAERWENLVGGGIWLDF